MKILDYISAKFFLYGNKCLGRIIKFLLKFKKNIYGLNIDEVREQKIIISMATYNKRYATIIPTLKSILHQSIKADKIIVWLDNECPQNKITTEMEDMKKFGVEFRYTEDGLKAHKKYYYAMKEFPNDIIITIDDDLVYSSNMIKSLLDYYKKNSDVVCARRVHKITFDFDGNIKPYVEWKYEFRKEKKESYLLCATGGAGTLYPPGILPEEAFDIENIKRLCLNADDIWLKVMQLINHKKVIWVRNLYVMPYETKNSQNTALNTGNTLQGGNDEYISLLKEVYPKAFELLYKEKENV